MKNLPDNPKDIKLLLQETYGNPQSTAMSPYERVRAAIERKPSDRVPFDFWGVPETIEKLKKYLEVDTEEEMLQLLGIDCRIVLPDYIGPELQKLEDGTFYNEWGSHRRVVANEFSKYEEYASFPLVNCQTADEVNAWKLWPRTEYWDWDSLEAKIQRHSEPVPLHVRYDVGGIFETAWGLYGLDKFLMDLIEKPEVPCAIMDRITDIFIDNFTNLMKVAKGKIEMVYTYDDIAIQNGLIMSPRMWRKHILPRHQRLNALIKDHNVKILYHSCGAVFPLINELIEEMHIDVLNPLQPRAKGMDMQAIKDQFGDRIAFHGGIDLQKTLPYGTQQDVHDEVRNRIDILAKDGGYICTAAHYIQADVPIDNIMAMYLTDRSL